MPVSSKPNKEIQKAEHSSERSGEELKDVFCEAKTTVSPAERARREIKR